MIDHPHKDIFQSLKLYLKCWCSILNTCKHLALSFLLAFTAEALGVNYGWIFGSYHYTEMLGIQLFGVPFLAALAWEPILYASFIITDLLVHPYLNRKRSVGSYFLSSLGMALVGAVATTAWDLMIDPIAVSEGWWVWHDGGAYIPYLQNGVPIQNYIGWLLVAFVIQLTYRLITNNISQSNQNNLHLSIYGPILLYSSLFVTSFGVTITILKRPEIGLTGIMAMGPFIFLCLFNIRFIIDLFQTKVEQQFQKV